MSPETPRVVAIGELLWDRIPGKSCLGGAPANFAVHAASLGARSVLVSRVGKDPDGESAAKMLSAKGVDTTFLQMDDRLMTGEVRVEISDGEPSYQIVEQVAWDAIGWDDRLSSTLGSVDAVCFGTLAQRHPISRATIQRFVKEIGDRCFKVLDLNFRQHYHSPEVIATSLHLADMVKLSLPELPVLRKYDQGSADDRSYFADLKRRFALDCIVLSLGARGCRVIGEDYDFTMETVPKDVVNTVGAGDAFTAAFVVGRLSGSSPEACAEMANRAGGFVVTREDGMPILPSEFRIF